ncbi:molybdenum cofactor biosynthesis protein MoeB [Thermoplasmatales archaeon SW_10_69_26]|nr:MAG: molybdenum cofactor biosynthesis protein MoeB [Thermoplasmatales archaeon SW_10_69_26]
MVTVKIPAPLRSETDDNAEAYPGLEKHLVDDDGDLNRFVNFFKNGTNVRELEGPDTGLDEDDEVLVLPAVAGGDPTNPNHLPNLSQEELRFYGRHLILPQVGREGQQELKSSSAIVVGAGGLGAPTLLYLAAAGVGRIGIVDPDVVNASNLHRQILYDYEDEGRKKVEVAKERLEGLNPHIEIETYDTRLTNDNALAILEDYDVVLDGTDNFPTRYLTNDACVLLDKPNVHASIFRFEGQASVFWADEGPCYRCLYPEPPPPGLVPNCAEGGVLGVLPGTLGVLQATEAVKLLLDEGEPLTGRLVLYNAMEGSFDEVDINADPECPVCGDDPEVTELVDYQAFCGITQEEDESAELTVQQLADRLGEEGLHVLDVREDWERDIVKIDGSEHIPLDDLPDEVSQLPAEKDVVVYCKSGGRSAKATELLRSVGLNAFNLQGGTDAWVQQIATDKQAY